MKKTPAGSRLAGVFLCCTNLTQPTGNLDSKSSHEIMEILGKLHAEGKTVILITHDDGIAASAKRVIRIMDGKIELDEEKQNEKDKE